MLRSLLAVGCGCFVGGILRYLLTLLLPGAADGRFPWSTFAANALGCLLIGLLSGWLSRIAAPDALLGIRTRYHDERHNFFGLMVKCTPERGA